ncbi:hypothetical protein QN277_012007 [Acacia crassicarpa]|uniref:Reverse transcriptase domain-containing protein n=1 Tax=Acacia crassicarpa TaxID=499986 RepID=A0AAE1N092_9FABA|nr:hypothetical protein QN277_012007 [Acacia crassicarpa]
MTSHLSAVFLEEQVRRPPLCCSISFPAIGSSELGRLGHMVTDQEIKQAVFSMGALKAPGPDGLNALFYQSQWTVVGKSVCEAIRSMWGSPSTIQSVNDTLIVLIPKKDHPEIATDFRPISLCNVIFKVLTKVIANRLKVVLPKLISPHQCSFVPGRHSSDNIVVAQEVIHSMQKLQGKRGFMAIKIDLEKAYDRVNSHFLYDCLKEMNMPDSAMDVIYSCVTSPSMQLLWNGDRAGKIRPTKGVRQGDPLSPYLFVICMERLAHLIQERISHGGWRPINLSRGGPPISHLFFADDVVLFVEAAVNQAEEVRNCLDYFCMASGLKVNTTKTRVFFSKNVNHIRRIELCNVLGFQVTPDLGKYLGVPLHHKRVTKRSYQGIVDKVRHRLSSWKVTSLSLAGRATLVSAVMSAIPGYTMQTVALPKGTCEEIEKQNRSFLWGSTQEKRKMHLVDWDTVCKPKKNGGLGLKHLYRQNQAYMMKLGWNMMKSRDDLWVKVLRSKYKCGDDLVPTINCARLGSNAWSGIKKSWEAVMEGSLVDDGSQTVRWKHERNGEFGVKSAYRVLSENQEEVAREWQWVWKLRTLPRCKAFMWLALHNKLLTNEVRVLRGMGGDGRCPWCGDDSESLIHVLRDCSETRKLWMLVGGPSLMSRFFQLERQPWLSKSIQRGRNRGKEGWSELFSTVCWLIWQRRNAIIFKNTCPSNDSIMHRARSIVETMSKASLMLKGVNLNGRPEQPRSISWSPPCQGWVKLNVDGACSQDQVVTGGGVLRDEYGAFKAGFMFKAATPADSFAAEVWAVLFGMKMCWDLGERRVVLESNAREVVELINGPIQESQSVGEVVREVKSILNRDWEVLVQWVPREINMVADYVAKQAFDVWPGVHQFHASFGDLAKFLNKDRSLSDICSRIV